MTKSYGLLAIIAVLSLLPPPTAVQEPVYWDVVDRIRSEGFDNSQVMDSAGYLADYDHLEVPIRQSGRVRSAADIAGTIIRVHEGTPLTIGQVAEVRLGAAPKRGTGADGDERGRAGARGCRGSR